MHRKGEVQAVLFIIRTHTFEFHIINNICFIVPAFQRILKKQHKVLNDCPYSFVAFLAGMLPLIHCICLF
jgi:hypothetical protein